MEIEPKPPVVAKKLWHIVRTLFYMLKTGILKSKMVLDINLMLKRGNKLAGKAIGNLIFHHNSFSCRSNGALSYVPPKDYEFSCSNTPVNYFNHLYPQKRKNYNLARSCRYEDANTVQAVQKVLEMLNNEAGAGVEASPLRTLPGFGRSPMGRQLRITDSPFPLKEEEQGDSRHVDKAADDFIKNFYKDLKMQKNTAGLESPYYDSWGR